MMKPATELVPGDAVQHNGTWCEIDSIERDRLIHVTLITGAVVHFGYGLVDVRRAGDAIEYDVMNISLGFFSPVGLTTFLKALPAHLVGRVMFRTVSGSVPQVVLDSLDPQMAQSVLGLVVEIGQFPVEIYIRVT